MNLKEHIRKVLREETYFNISEDKYSKLIKNVILDYVNFNICALAVKQLSPQLKDQYLVILITDIPLKTYYREELEKHLNDYIPATIYVSISDGVDCGNYKKNINLTEQVKDPVTVLSGLEKDIDNLLGYYFKSEDGKFYDINDTTKSKPVDLSPTAGFLKTKVESVMYGAKGQPKFIPQLEQITNRIKNGKFKMYFGDWDTIKTQPQKFDYYTGNKCTSPNKNPGCGPIVG